ncbi:MAG TPA: hypothetical protein GXX37_12505 [Clostridiaceae bacterium]|nr:hypothetical protein [Clostridiaceae bacterium]
MKRNKRKIAVACLVLFVVLGIASFISYSKFNVLSPFSTAYGLFQVIFTDKEYVVIQKYPRVIVAKPTVSLQEYMKNLGFEEDTENQMGALHRFQSNDTVQYVIYSVNKYFSKWRWQE